MSNMQVPIGLTVTQWRTVIAVLSAPGDNHGDNIGLELRRIVRDIDRQLNDGLMIGRSSRATRK